MVSVGTVSARFSNRSLTTVISGFINSINNIPDAISQPAIFRFTGTAFSVFEVLDADDWPDF
jgi:hypothetical protein